MIEKIEYSLLITGVCLIVVALIIPLVKKIALHINAMDIPTNAEGNRHIHKKPMPKLGGLGIFLGFLFGYMLFGEQSIRMNSILIGSFIVVLMGIVYAAFATNLTITGTGSLSNNWCIGFDSTRTSDYQATAGISGGTVPTGSMSFSGDSCSTSFKTTASLNASFTIST